MPFSAGACSQGRLAGANTVLIGMFLLLTLLTFPLFPLYVLACMCQGYTLARSARCGIWRYARTVMQALSPLVPVHIENIDMVKQHAPCILVANHQSFLDLYLFGLQSEPDLCMFTKSWPFRLLFFFAPAMRAAGYINVEVAGHEKTENLAIQRLQDGATVIVFPEGRRSRDGQLGRLHSGAFRLAIRAGIPVIPLIISGSGAVFPAGARRFTPGPVHMHLLSPLYPKDFAADPIPHRAMLKKTRDLFKNHL